MQKLDLSVQERLANLVQVMGHEWVGYQFSSEAGRTIFRVYIDNPGGVTISACAKVSSQLSSLLDVEELIAGEYRLEVSSPGINRPLFALEQYHKAVGQKIKLRLYAPVNGRKQYAGTLLQVEKESIQLQLEDVGTLLTFPISAVEKANVQQEINFKKKKDLLKLTDG